MSTHLKKMWLYNTKICISDYVQNLDCVRTVMISVHIGRWEIKRVLDFILHARSAYRYFYYYFACLLIFYIVQLYTKTLLEIRKKASFTFPLEIILFSTEIMNYVLINVRKELKWLTDHVISMSKFLPLIE